MNIICMLNKDSLYDEALKEGVPFFQWNDWILKRINKEVMTKILTKSGQVSAAASAVKNANKEKDSGKVSLEKKPAGTITKDTLLKIQAVSKEKEIEKKSEKAQDGGKQAANAKKPQTSRPALMF